MSGNRCIICHGPAFFYLLDLLKLVQKTTLAIKERVVWNTAKRS
jgi:hypothetical protein